MKRKGLIIATSVVFAVVLCALCARRPILRYRFYKTTLWQFNADYKACAEDFNTVKDYFSDNYQGGPDKLFSVSRGIIVYAFLILMQKNMSGCPTI